MKKIGSMNIDGVYFNVYERMTKFPKLGHRDLYDCYKNPSRIKKEIWRNISTFFVTYGGVPTIRSYNTHMFTVNGTVYIKNHFYYCEIFPTHNDLYIIY